MILLGQKASQTGLRRYRRNHATPGPSEAPSAASEPLQELSEMSDSESSEMGVPEDSPASPHMAAMSQAMQSTPEVFFDDELDLLDM
ncbi:unnamed protein product [Sympodiomycopsis kandeliae]